MRKHQHVSLLHSRALGWYSALLYMRFSSEKIGVAVGLAFGVVTLACGALADDWPRWRGPNLNGISSEKGWSSEWPAAGPKTLWKASVGTGFSSMSVAQGRVYTMGYGEEKDVVYCLDAKDGKILWQHEYESDLGDKYFEGGPTSTPTVDGKSVYALSRWGDVFCFEAATGKIQWSKNVQKETNARIPGWGFAGSPLVHGNLLLRNIGEAGMALEKATGKIAWSSANKDAGYSTPLPFKRGGTELALFSSGKSFAAVDIKTGKQAWSIPWVTQYGVNAADPIVKDDYVFVSSGYGKGAGLWKIGEGEPKPVWQNKEMRNQMNPSVLVDGYLYGVDGDAGTKPSLKCVEFLTGTVKWTEPRVGSGSVAVADGKLIVLSDKGELMIADASPAGFKPTARAQVLGGKCWTVPVLANGQIYCRNVAGDLVCVDIAGQGAGATGKP